MSEFCFMIMELPLDAGYEKVMFSLTVWEPVEKGKTFLVVNDFFFKWWVSVDDIPQKNKLQLFLINKVASQKLNSCQRYFEFICEMLFLA